jgi:hypothetical protein
MRLRRAWAPLPLVLALAPCGVARAAGPLEDVCAKDCLYPTLAEAIQAVPIGGEGTFVVAGTSWPQTGTLWISEGRRVTFVANGTATVTNTGVGPVFYVSGPGASLSLEGFSLTGFNDRALRVDFKSAVTLDDVVLFTIGLLDQGGAALVENATLTAVDTLFLDNVATGDGGQLLARNASVTLTDCRFTGGFGGRGGAIAFLSTNGDPGSVLTVTGTTFEDNLAAEVGGALYVEGPVQVDIDDTLFVRNTTQTDGGAIADGLPVDDPLGGAVIDLHEVEFDENQADQAGGAIRVAHANTALLADGSVFRGNVAGSGGALWIGGGQAALVRNLLCENFADRGGAISSSTPSSQTWTNNRLLANSASDQGGGIDHAGGALTLEHFNLLANVAGVGGAVSSTSAIVLRSSLVGWTEGGTAVSVPTLTIDRDLFWSNAGGDLRDQVIDAEFEDLGTSVFDQDPLLDRFLPALGCDAADDYYNYYGPLVDAGDPYDSRDPDLTVADIGAFGSSNAPQDPWLEDYDEDGAPRLYDCVEGDETFFPGAKDPPYDGRDTNCDLTDDFDLDGDGWPGPEIDCEDQDPEVDPGAADRPGQDRSCDGVVDFDGDGYRMEDDCDDEDPEVHPGAVEDPGPRDLDCTPPADVVRPLEPRTCSSGPLTSLWLVGVVALALRRRSSAKADVA